MDYTLEMFLFTKACFDVVGVFVVFSNFDGFGFDVGIVVGGGDNDFEWFFFVIVRYLPPLVVDTPPVDDAFALSTTRGGVFSFPTLPSPLLLNWRPCGAHRGRRSAAPQP